MTHTVSGLTMRSILEGIKKVSGPQYKLVLQMSGLGRFEAEDNWPAADFTPVATQQELETIFGSIYKLLGESITRLFLRNYSAGVLQVIAGSDWWQAQLARSREIPAGQRLGWSVQMMVQASKDMQWATAEFQEDDKAYYMLTRNCPICAQIAGSHAPLCASEEQIYGGLVLQLVGYRVVVREVACMAMGAPACKVAFYKK
ncbi:MAG TPA: V4R domain-containing protein [Chloroflexia bacterium]|nr:V4R domain-containing protein [Chloroflexia bacterium]